MSGDHFNKNGVLFLGGGGNSNDSFILDQEFLKTLKSRKFLYVPIALERDEIGYEACYDWITKTFLEISKEFVDITMWLNLVDKKLEDLLEFDALYFGGGNTYRLLNEIRKTSFDKLTVDFIKRGKSFYGGSAGAIILGETVDTAQFVDKNEANIKDTHGLGLINGYSVWCHYQSPHDQQIKTLLTMGDGKIIAIPEKSGVCISNSKAKVLGTESVSSFSGRQKSIHAPGEVFFLE